MPEKTGTSDRKTCPPVHLHAVLRREMFHMKHFVGPNSLEWPGLFTVLGLIHVARIPYGQHGRKRDPVFANSRG